MILIAIVGNIATEKQNLVRTPYFKHALSKQNRTELTLVVSKLFSDYRISKIVDFHLTLFIAKFQHLCFPI